MLQNCYSNYEMVFPLDFGTFEICINFAFFCLYSSNDKLTHKKVTFPQFKMK